MLVELLSKAATVAMLTFVVSSMLAMGAGLTVSQIFEPLRNARLVMLALLANFVLMPLGALALAKVLWWRRSDRHFEKSRGRSKVSKGHPRRSTTMVPVGLDSA
jgi:ACR3 family arsenite efflux pump ArsB